MHIILSNNFFLNVLVGDKSPENKLFFSVVIGESLFRAVFGYSLLRAVFGDSLLREVFGDSLLRAVFGDSLLREGFGIDNIFFIVRFLCTGIDIFFGDGLFGDDEPFDLFLNEIK